MWPRLERYTCAVRTEFKPGMPVVVLRVRDGGFDYVGRKQGPMEVWEPAKFVRYDDGKPVVQWPDGSMEVLLKPSDMR